MNLLLDTHAFLWFDMSPERISEPAMQALLSSDNNLYLSVVSIWEMQIKSQLGKLKLSGDLAKIVRNQESTNGIKLLPLNPPHIYNLASLPEYHKDPFDRLLIAQAKTAVAASGCGCAN